MFALLRREEQIANGDGVGSRERGTTVDDATETDGHEGAQGDAENMAFFNRKKILWQFILGLFFRSPPRISPWGRRAKALPDVFQKSVCGFLSPSATRHVALE